MFSVPLTSGTNVYRRTNVSESWRGLVGVIRRETRSCIQAIERARDFGNLDGVIALDRNHVAVGDDPAIHSHFDRVVERAIEFDQRAAFEGHHFTKRQAGAAEAQTDGQFDVEKHAQVGMGDWEAAGLGIPAHDAIFLAGWDSQTRSR